MPSEALTLATDGCRDKGTKRCAHCRRWKASDQFPRSRNRPGGLDCWCSQCRRLAAHTHYHEGGGKAAKAAYGARPDVKARRAGDEKRRARCKAGKAAYWKTPRGKLVQARSKARRRLRVAATDEQRARFEAVIAACDREFARLDREHELPAEPARARAARGSKSPCRGCYRTRSGTYAVKISVGRGEVCRGGTFATAAEAKDAANALAFRLLGIHDYARPREPAGDAEHETRA